MPLPYPGRVLRRGGELDGRWSIDHLEQWPRVAMIYTSCGSRSLDVEVPVPQAQQIVHSRDRLPPRRGPARGGQGGPV
eukprot:7186017-Prymnesium_polylepis.1